MNLSLPDNTSIHIEHLKTLSPTQSRFLSNLINVCDYEPYYAEESDSSIFMYAAYKEDIMVGFLSFLVSEDDSTAEITALVHPDFRKMGIFSTLLSFGKSHFLSFIGSIPESLIQSHFPYADDAHIVFTEYMMKLTETTYYHFQANKSERFPSIQSDVKSSTQSTLDSTECEFCFSDDETEYYMYENEDADEPCALLCLAPENTFTNVYGVWVDESMRGKGVGTVLMQAFLEDYFQGTLDERGDKSNSSSAAVMPPLVLNVRSTNLSAVTLYRKCGFTEVSHVHYYQF